jgi:transposase
MDILQYIGVDFHPYQQTIAFVDKFGEIKTRQFYHADKVSLRKFYQQFPKGSIVGVEASGSFRWFEKMLFELQFELEIGNPSLIRKMALSVHKSDKRDAEHILDLLLTGRFPAVQKRSEKSQIILAWLNYRDSLVRHRTAIGNQLQAMARSFGLARFQTKSKLAKERIVSQTNDADLLFLINSRFTCFENLSKEIALIEEKLHLEARQPGKVVANSFGNRRSDRFVSGSHARRCWSVCSSRASCSLCRTRTFERKFGRKTTNRSDQQTRFTSFEILARTSRSKLKR